MWFLLVVSPIDAFLRNPLYSLLGLALQCLELHGLYRLFLPFLELSEVEFPLEVDESHYHHDAEVDTEDEAN